MELGVQRQSFLDIGNQQLPVPLNGEMLHRVIAIRFVQAVPVQRIIAGSDRQPADAEALFSLGMEQVIHHSGPFILRQLAQCGIAQFIEAAAKAFQCLVAVIRNRQIGRCRFLRSRYSRLRHLTLGPRRLLCAGIPFEIYIRHYLYPPCELKNSAGLPETSLSGMPHYIFDYAFIIP
ncbi:hypothetical protein D3C73_521390 [compost metagenome]